MRHVRHLPGQIKCSVNEEQMSFDVLHVFKNSYVSSTDDADVSLVDGDVVKIQWWSLLKLTT